VAAAVIRIHRDSIIWLAVAALAFTLAVLLFTPLRMNLGWDETVYASQISQHVPIMRWGPERSRGMPLLVAPVTLLTGSVVVLRVYLALLAGGALFLALLAWRGLKPTWVLAIAGVIFGGLGLAQAEASLLFPNYWIAIGALATVGLFLRGLVAPEDRAVPEDEVPSRGLLALLVAATAFTALMRPADAVFIVAPLLIAAIVTMARHGVGRQGVWRRPAALTLAVAAGLVIGLGEWVAEAYLYFHGPFARLKAAGQAVGGTTFDPVANLRILGGGRTSSVRGYPGLSGWSHPGFLFWWLAFGALVLVGIYVGAKARGWFFAAAPALCALSVYLLYSLPVRDNARYLLPAWALLAIPAAEGIGWLATERTGKARVAAVAAGAVFLAAGLATQHVVLSDQTRSLQTAARLNTNTANALHQLGVRAPCVITSVDRPHFATVSKPAAYYLGCSYVANMRHAARAPSRQVVVLVLGSAPPWAYAAQWGAHKLAGTADVVAYIGSRHG
jgi:hypothetical protein